MVQLNLNLMPARTVPVAKNTVSCAHNYEHMFFANLHVNENPLHVTHEHTVDRLVSLVTRYKPESTSNTQVKRIHEGKKSYTQVCSPLSTGTLSISMASITTSLVYLHAVTYHAFY